MCVPGLRSFLLFTPLVTPWGSEKHYIFGRGLKWWPKNNMKKKKELLKRVQEMEDRYNAVSRSIAGLDEAISEFKEFKPELAILKEYMESGQWKADFESDEASTIPEEVKRGVLSEDGLYDLLEGADKILAFAKEVLE